MKIVVAYRGAPRSPGRATGDALIRAFRQLGHEAVGYGRWYQTCDWFGTDAAGDLLVYLECNDEDPQYDELRHFKGKIVYWEFDTAIHSGRVPNLTADVAFLANKRLWAAAASPHYVRYLPYAFDPTSMEPQPGPRAGAAIIGSHFRERDEFAAALGLEVRQAYGDDYARAVSSLLVHVHHFDSGGEGLIVARPWETMGLGTALLTPRTTELEEFFADGVHCVMYDSLGDAKDKLKAMLASPESTLEIGTRGRAEILARHTYAHRAAEILRVVNA